MGEVYSHLSEEERQVIQIKIGNGTSIRAIGAMLGRNASSISREIKRNTWFPSNERVVPALPAETPEGGPVGGQVVLLQFFLSNFCTIFPQHRLPVSNRNRTV